MMESVSYSDGMFAREPLGEVTMFTHFAEMEATCHHEASHAVVGYAFGEPIHSVGVSSTHIVGDGGELTVSYGGEVRHGPNGKRRHIDFPYRPLHFRTGVGFASGPAGERRYRHEAEVPMRLLGASEGDHEGISVIGKMLAMRGRSRWAYQRLVWYAAQRIIADNNVWEAVREVAECLFNEMSWQEPDETVAGVVWAYIDPGDVYRACRRHEITRGMLKRQR